MSLIFVISGVVLVTFSRQESYTEENTIGKWDVSRPYSTLTPLTLENLTGWAPVEEGSYFELNVSASNRVRVRIGNPTWSETKQEVWTDPVFDQSGTQFTRKVAINGTSNLVEIQNEGMFPVNISGNILLKKISLLYQAVYPYSSLGTISLLIGPALLVYGVITSPRKRHSGEKARKISRCARFSSEISLARAQDITYQARALGFETPTMHNS